MKFLPDGRHELISSARQNEMPVINQSSHQAPMRSKAKMILLIGGPLIGGPVILLLCFLLYVGVLSTPRNVSSPQVIIRLIDENGSPVAGIEVSRFWTDSDLDKSGSEEVMTDQSGTARFPRVPARVGLFTGAWRKAYQLFGACGSGSGTSTSISVRYHDRCNVAPKDVALRKAGQAYQDANGAWFDPSTDTSGNTLVKLSFLDRTKDIDYVLSSSVQTK